jgi:hypothetical protein
MVAYTGIKGGKVQNFSSDPSNPFVGQVWYNTTSSQVKVRSSNASGAWTTGGSLNTARDLFSRSRNSNSCFSFWRITTILIQVQQNLIMEQLGHLLQIV